MASLQPVPSVPAIIVGLGELQRDTELLHARQLAECEAALQEQDAIIKRLTTTIFELLDIINQSQKAIGHLASVGGPRD
mgnify:CR=1 FL=1